MDSLQEETKSQEWTNISINSKFEEQNIEKEKRISSMIIESISKLTEEPELK